MAIILTFLPIDRLIHQEFKSGTHSHTCGVTEYLDRRYIISWIGKGIDILLQLHKHVDFDGYSSKWWYILSMKLDYYSNYSWI